MPLEGEILYRTREDILAELQDEMQALIPDIYLGEDGNLNLLFQVMSGVFESIFLANQIVNQDMFIQTASEASLEKWGAQYGIPRKVGTPSTGTLRFTGDGGTFIPVGAEVAADPGTGEDPQYFITTQQGTIPNIGDPTTPSASVQATAGNLNGTYEYVVTLVTAAGESLPGPESNAVFLNNQQGNVSGITIGGAGTIARKLYRQKDGAGGYRLVTTLNDNTTTVYIDNILEGSLGGGAPEIDTAHVVSLTAQSEENGSEFNATPGSILTVTDVPDGVTDVTNPAAFVGGSSREGVESFRIRLLDAIRNPETGSVFDLVGWALEIDGVDSATAYENDNLGTPTNGHATVRISGPEGTTPPAGVISAVQAYLDSKDMANITIHVGAFTSVATNVSVTITLDPNYALSDVTPGVTKAIQDYINSLAIGETLRVTGIIASIIGLPGVIDVAVTTPATNQATGSTSKRTPGTITVS